MHFFMKFYLILFQSNILGPIYQSKNGCKMESEIEIELLTIVCLVFSKTYYKIKGNTLATKDKMNLTKKSIFTQLPFPM